MGMKKPLREWGDRSRIRQQVAIVIFVAAAVLRAPAAFEL